MSSQTLISVVIIFLDAERFIGDAIESVLAQTYPHWELLLVDDGSTDGGSAIGRRYAETSPDRIRYLEHPGHRNRGMSASRNLGVRASSGQHVALLDADDVWLPGKLEKQLSILEANPKAAMVYGPTEWWYSWTGKPEDAQRDFIHELGVSPNSVIEPPTLLAGLLRNEGISPCTCSILVRREVFDRVGGFEECFRGLYEDQAFCAKVCLDWPVIASDECSYRYRQHGGSALYVADRMGTRQAARSIFLDWLASYLMGRGVADADLWQILEGERLRSRGAMAARVRGRARGLWRAARARRLGALKGGSQ